MIWLTLLMELWTTAPQDTIQHRYGFHAEAAITVVGTPIQVSGHLGLLWWGQPKSLIPHNPLNLEANGWIERNYGVSVAVPISLVTVGVQYARRGTEQLGVSRVWSNVSSGKAGTIGYHDGVRGILSTTFLEVRSPYLWKPNDTAHTGGLTLPWYDWEISSHIRSGPLTLVIDVWSGGPRAETVADVGVDYRLGVVALGVRCGAVPVPFVGPAVARTALHAEVTLR